MAWIWIGDGFSKLGGERAEPAPRIPRALLTHPARLNPSTTSLLSMRSEKSAWSRARTSSERVGADIPALGVNYTPMACWQDFRALLAFLIFYAWAVGIGVGMYFLGNKIADLEGQK